jgi:hypothetical protein
MPARPSYEQSVKLKKIIAVHNSGLEKEARNFDFLLNTETHYS